MQGCTGQLRQRVAKNDLLIFGCIMDCRSGAIVEAYHEAGYDVLMIDREHTALNSETILEHIRVARCLNMPCMVRVAEDCYHELNRTLDQGPDGIFVPRIRSRAQVEALVRMVKYPPLGIRGLAGSTCPVGKYIGWSSVAEQVETINRDLIVGIQIETAEALDDLDGILSVPGVDIAVVGNDDLSLGMGIPGQLQHPDFLAAIHRIIATCQQYGVMPGIACGDPHAVREWASHGMRAFWYCSDIALLYQGVATHRLALETALQEKNK